LSQPIPGIIHEAHSNYEHMTNRNRDYSKLNAGQNADCACVELIKRTNLDIEDTACLHMVHILQHPTSRTTTRTTHDTMLNALKTIFSPLPAGQYGKSTMLSTRRRHQANEGRRTFEAERIRALGVLGRLRSEKMHSAEKRRERNFLNNEQREKWIEDYVERETAVARK